MDSEAAEKAELRQFLKDHWLMLVVAMAFVLIDGMDVQALAFAGPAILDDWGLPAAELGPVFSSGLVGMVIGSLLLTPVSDRFGRRPLLIGAAIWFGCITIATSFASSVPELLALRFLNGIGLGCVLPTVLALISEYAPARQRPLFVMAVASGFSLGAALGGLVAAWIIPAQGWHSLFLAIGIGSLVVGLSGLCLPESAAIRARGRVGAGPQASMRSTLAILFSPSRRRATLLLWLAHMMNLGILYFLASWIPTILRQEGLSFSLAAFAGASLQVGSIAGALLLGWAISRRGYFAVLPGCYALGALSVIAVGASIGHGALLIAATFTAGLFVLGGLNAINALALTAYPVEARSSGLGWALGVGRLGSILAPLAGSGLLALGWPTSLLIGIVALPALVIAGSLLALRSVMPPLTR